MAYNKGKTINVNTKHLTKGDPLPPYNGKLRVFSMRYCPFAQRTILALIAKGIDYEVVNIDTIDKPEWLTSKSAFAKIPAIEIADGVSIYESLITVEYLDDVYPERPLLPKDPVKKAFDKIIVETIGPIDSVYIALLKNRDSITEDKIKAYYKALEFIQEQLRSRGTDFLDGSEPGYADYMIWPWFERLRTYANDDKVKIDGKKYKILVEYIERMLKDPVVSHYLLPVDAIKKFQKAYNFGVKPEYDLLLSN